MSLKTAIDDIATLTPKSAGHLIRHEDWNLLVQSLGEYGSALTEHQAWMEESRERLLRAEQALQTLDQDLDQARVRLAALEQQVQPLLGLYRITLSTPRSHCLSGELCELTARVTDLSGAPLPAPFPWVDFVSAWGRLRAQGGFNTRAGAGDNSLSVQVNADGIARVWVRAEHSEGFSHEEEEEVGATLQLQEPQHQRRITELLLDAATPRDSRARAAYRMMHVEYERSDSTALRAYADTYHVRMPDWQIRPQRPDFTTRWRDYRATVMAFAKADGDPTTPDEARGTASIQLVFRDWLGPWIVDYLDDTDGLRADIRDRLPHELFEADDFARRARDILADSAGQGVLRNRKWLDAMAGELERVQLDDPRVQRRKDVLETAVRAQGQVPVHGNPSHTDPAPLVMAQLGQYEVAAQAERLAGQQAGSAAAAAAQTQVLQESVNVLQGRMDSSDEVGRQISGKLTLIDDSVRAINAFDETSVQSNMRKINDEIQALRQRLG